MVSSQIWCADVASADLPAGVARCVYADPPYGTGRRFGADYHDSLIGGVVEQTIAAAYRVLAPEGFFWLHLDDRRVYQAKAVCDAVFGEKSFVTSVVWQRTTSTQTSAVNISRTHDVILLYRKGSPSLTGRDRQFDPATLFVNPDGDPRPWRRDSLATHGHRTVAQHYGVMNPITGKVFYPKEHQHWRWSKTKILSLLLQWDHRYAIDDKGNLVIPTPGSDQALARQRETPWPVLYFGNQGRSGPQVKSYRREKISWSSWWPADEVGSTGDGARESAAIGGRPFSTTKPSALMRRIIEISSTSGDTVVELCAGSGAFVRTAAQLGRHSIAVELNPETINRYIVPGVQPYADVEVMNETPDANEGSALP